MDSYNPTRLWVYKVREDGTLAADIFWYIDEEKPTDATAWEGRKDASKTFCTLIFHGLQDAGRKRSLTCQSPSKWEGTMVETINGRIMFLVSSNKWLRGNYFVE